MKKRIVSLVLVALMLFSMVACNSDKGNNSGTSSTSATTSRSTSAATTTTGGRYEGR